MISLSGVTKAWGSQPLFESVSAVFRPGELVCLVGPSGQGKSTLLRCMYGFSSFDEGSIEVFGETLRPRANNQKALAHIRARVGFVFQDAQLFPHRTVLGNVMEALVFVKRMSSEEARQRAERTLAEFGMDSRAHAYPKELSGGEAQRVAIARALVLEPDALLLDEPTSALDPERKSLTMTMLRKFADAGRLVIVVSHEVDLARSVSHRVCSLENRCLRQI